MQRQAARAAAMHYKIRCIARVLAQRVPKQCRLGNFGEFYTNSVGPVGHMLLDGAIDRNVTLVPDLDGFELQPYMKFFLEPFTIHPVSLSSVANFCYQ